MSAQAIAVAMMLGNAPVGPVDVPTLQTLDPVAAPQIQRFETPSAAPAVTANARNFAANEGGEEEITVSAHRGHAPGDPIQAVNQTTFAAMEMVDKAVIGPVAHRYEHTVPRPARDGLRNFFRNLHEPIVALNFLLQLKPGRVAKTFGRFALNSTVGGAGLFDMARRRPFNMQFQPNGFANTLAYYGVKPGPFLVLPMIGATTLRDLIGRGVDMAFYPVPGGRPFGGTAYTTSATTFKTLNRRVDFDGALVEIRQEPNAYASYRERYMARRAEEVASLHSKPRRGDAPIELAGPVKVPVMPQD